MSSEYIVFKLLEKNRQVIYIYENYKGSKIETCDTLVCHFCHSCCFNDTINRKTCLNCIFVY